MSGWIGVDLDGTLAFHAGGMGIGYPIPKMLERIKRWIKEGKEVRIMTARASVPELIPEVEVWLEKHGIGGLKVTNIKDFSMLELWDDRAVQIVPNTGIRADGRAD